MPNEKDEAGTEAQRATAERNEASMRKGEQRQKAEAGLNKEADQDSGVERQFSAYGTGDVDVNDLPAEAGADETKLPHGGVNPRVAGLTSDPTELAEGLSTPTGFPVTQHTHDADGNVVVAGAPAPGGSAYAPGGSHYVDPTNA